jgi:hypothetical protein
MQITIPFFLIGLLFGSRNEAIQIRLFYKQYLFCYQSPQWLTLANILMEYQA